LKEQLLVQLAAIVVLGISAQWVAWKLNLPAILLLLVAGFLAGPVPDWLGYQRLIDPDYLFHDLLAPIVSISVAVILFEGGLSLELREIAHAGRVIRNLVTLGAAVTWLIAALAGRWLVGLSWPLAILLGEVLVVTGPTVIGPLLRYVKPTGRTGPILKWEGIVIDPIGAMLAVLVFEALPTDNLSDMTSVLLMGSLKTVLIGGAAGLAGALITMLSLERFWMPDFLHNPGILMLVLAAFTVSNALQPESGLFAVTAMGIALANQQRVTVTHVVEFKENLTVLLVSSLFIILASRLSVEQIRAAGLRGAAFTLAMIVVARPLSVFVSTLGSDLSWRERAFLSWMAPRGIVAAAVASVFALRLRKAGYEGADLLVPITFTTIIGTVSIYGLTAGWLARRLGLSLPNTGFLIAGANPLARAIGAALRSAGQGLLLVDTNTSLVREARLAGLPVVYASVLSRYVQDRIDLSGIGRLLALTPNEEANSLAAVQFTRVFGRDQIYQLATDVHENGRKQKVDPQLSGRILFGPALTYQRLEAMFEAGAVVKRTPLTPEFTYEHFRQLHGDTAVALFLVDETGQVQPVTADATFAPTAGQALISLVSGETKN
jgi:NhaP-type Na+/H+ or K+/H+ antiporter